MPPAALDPPVGRGCLERLCAIPPLGHPLPEGPGRLLAADGRPVKGGARHNGGHMMGERSRGASPGHQGGEGVRLPLLPASPSHDPGGVPTIPLDPPTAYTLSSLFMLLGTDLIRAGRGRSAQRVAVGFAIFFGLTVQYFMFRWPAWMYSYFYQDDAFSLVWVSPVFFLAIVASSVLATYVTGRLIREGRQVLAIGNALLGFAAWFILWGVTWDPYFHVGTFAAYHAGLAPHSTEVAPFQVATAIFGASYVVVGVPLAIWVVWAGRRARALRRILPTIPTTPWREAAGGELAARVASARAAQASWTALPLAERRRCLLEVKRALLARAEEAATILEEELGRPKAESYVAEILPSADLFDHWIGAMPALLHSRPVAIDPLVFPGKRGVVEKVPRGVVGAIFPWNFPLAIPLRTLVPALLAGNAVVFKPSEHAPRTGAFIGALFDGHLPEGLLQVIQGGPVEGEALIRAGVDFLVFTGSRRGGEAVSRLCAETLTPSALELGAKDAAIVLEDADLPRAARGVIWGAFGNAGQNCAAIERCYVLAEVAEAFVGHLQSELAKLRVGAGADGEVDIGPLANDAQQSIVRGQLEEAEARGVRVLRGRQGQGARVVTPTILLDPPADLGALQEETFGPVLPVLTVASDEEAVVAANASPFGLTVSVWSKDLARAERLGRRIDAGVVTVNNHAFTGGLADAPWGGARGSGFGVTNGPETLEQLTRPRLVLVDKGKSKRELWWYPYDPGLLRLARGMARLRSGKRGAMGGLGDVIGGWLQRRKETR